jgi:chromosome segregation ATPase
MPAEAKKPKKVWTNEDVNGLSGPVSVVGNSKNSGKAGSSAKADPQYIANTRKELAKLQSQLDDTDKQLSDLKDFSEGKAPATSSGYQINKGYNRVPVDQQITSLQDKKKQLQDKIGALLDEARKKGVEPGDLR